MRHRKKTKTLGRKTSARKAVVRDLVTSLITFEKIETTMGKAKVARPMVEKMVTVARTNDLATRRYLMTYFSTEQPIKKLLEVLGPRYATRTGGYTRLTKLGVRQGDAAEKVLVEFV